MLSYSLENALMVAVFQLLIAGLIFCSSSAILYMQREARTFLSLVAAASFSYCLFSFLKSVILYRGLSASVGPIWPAERYFLPDALEKAALVLVGRVLDAHDFRDSALYAGAQEHVLRKRKTAKLAGVSLSFNLLWW